MVPTSQADCIKVCIRAPPPAGHLGPDPPVVANQITSKSNASGAFSFAQNTDHSVAACCRHSVHTRVAVTNIRYLYAGIYNV